jgi:hypothetical protein
MGHFRQLLLDEPRILDGSSAIYGQLAVRPTLSGADMAA